MLVNDRKREKKKQNSNKEIKQLHNQIIRTLMIMQISDLECRAGRGCSI